MAWEAAAAYNQRSRIEAQIGRWKSVIGDRLHARNIDNQITKPRVAPNALNHMTALGRADYERIY